MEERTARSAVACNACRTKKQKCGGEKPTCARCQQFALDCVWPRQQKRGPAKGYTEALEARLSETEEVLFRVLSCISTEDLSRVLLENPLDAVSSHPKADAPDRKQAVECWSKSSLKTLADIQNWYDDRSRVAASAVEPAERTSTLQDLAEHASFQPTASSDDQNMPTDYEQQASAIARISGGDFGEGSATDLEPMGSLENVGAGEVLYHTGPRKQRHVQHIQNQQNQKYLHQHQPQRQPQPQPQHPLHWNSTMLPIQASGSGDTDNFTQQADSVCTNSLGLTQKFQEDFLW